MTDDTDDHDFDGDLRCTDCWSRVTITRDAYDRLVATCDCSHERHLKVSQALPEGWSG